jgi:hypothetical protein
MDERGINQEARIAKGESVKDVLSFFETVLGVKAGLS